MARDEALASAGVATDDDDRRGKGIGFWPGADVTANEIVLVGQSGRRSKQKVGVLLVVVLYNLLASA